MRDIFGLYSGTQTTAIIPPLQLLQLQLNEIGFPEEKKRRWNIDYKIIYYIYYNIYNI